MKQRVSKPKGFAKFWEELKAFREMIWTRNNEHVVGRAGRCELNPISLSFPFYASAKISPDVILNELRILNGFSFFPNCGNMGDIFIATAEYQFFEKHELKYEMFQKHSPQENLVYGGGGLFVREWKIFYQWLLNLIRKDTWKRIVFLPSSFHDCPDFLEIVDERFTIFCREEKSRNYLLSSGIKGKVILTHDMALSLTEDFQKTNAVLRPRFKEVYRRIVESIPKLTQQDGYTVACFLRSDRETTRIAENSDFKSTLDLSRCIYSDCRDPGCVAFYSKLFLACIDTADIVITDRLHIGIGAMLIGKEVFLLDNSYGKVSGIYEHSLKQCSRVHFVKDVHDLRGIIDRTVAEGKVQRTASLENLKKIGDALP